jgi:hypothetical protein
MHKDLIAETVSNCLKVLECKIRKLKVELVFRSLMMVTGINLLWHRSAPNITKRKLVEFII